MSRYRPQHFTQDELADDMSLGSDKLWRCLDAFRDRLGVPIHPSPAPGSLARTSGSTTSMHHVDLRRGRYSLAIDVFIPDMPPDFVFLEALMFGWGGVGAYFDTQYSSKAEVMFHLDLRHLGIPQNGGGKPKTYWYRELGEYHWPHQDPSLIGHMMTMLADW